MCLYICIYICVCVCVYQSISDSWKSWTCWTYWLFQITKINADSFGIGFWVWHWTHFSQKISTSSFAYKREVAMSESWKNRSMTHYSISQKIMMINWWTRLIKFSNSTQIEFNDPVTTINNSLEVNDFFCLFMKQHCHMTCNCVHTFHRQLPLFWGGCESVASQKILASAFAVLHSWEYIKKQQCLDSWISSFEFNLFNKLPNSVHKTNDESLTNPTNLIQLTDSQP